MAHPAPAPAPLPPSGSASHPEARRRVEALVALLGDPSERVWETVREELLALGGRARPALRRLARRDHARARARARGLLGELDQRETLRRLARRAARQRLDLESSLFLLGRLDQPQLDARPYRRALDAMAEEVRRRARREPRGLSRAFALVDYLAKDLAFSGARDDYHHPDNIHLHRAIERKRGMPLTLVAIYLAVARRVGVRAAAVPLPGHVMLRVYGDNGEDRGTASTRAVLVDPFEAGKLRTRSECKAYLQRNGLAGHPQWFRDADDGMLFLRHVNNLWNSQRLRRADGALVPRGLAGGLRGVVEVARRAQERPSLAPAGRA